MPAAQAPATERASGRGVAGSRLPHTILWSWLGLALINALVLALSLPSAPATTVAWHHALDAGHMAALGLVSAGLVTLWRRLGAKRPWVTLFGAAFVVDGVVLFEDLTPRASKLAASGAPALVWVALLTLVASATIPAFALAGRWAHGRRSARIVAVSAAVTAAVLNHFVLDRNYPGVHLHGTLLAAVLLAATLDGSLPRVPRPVWAALTLLAGFSVFVPPPNAVVSRAVSRSGSTLVPFVARGHAWLATRAATAPREPRHPRPPTTPPFIEAPPIVVLIGVDALRADVVADDRYADRLPTLHAMRETGVWFRQARTTAPATVVALSSLFSGRYFSELDWRTGLNGSLEYLPYADPTPRLGAVLSAGGVRTAIWHAGYRWSSPESGVFGHFDDSIAVPMDADERSRQYVRAPRLVDEMSRYLDAHPDGPLFLCMHWLEAHAPYDLAGTDGSAFERYLRELELVDHELARVRALLAQPGRSRRAVLIVMADHGEAFGEHQSYHHGSTVYDEMVRVPILVDSAALGAHVVDVPASLVDLGPTIVDLFGLTAPETFEGRSLLPLLRGQTRLDRPVLIDSGRHMRALVFDDGFKLIENRRQAFVELYDLRNDPEERENLADALPQETEARLAVLRSYFGPRELPFVPP